MMRGQIRLEPLFWLNMLLLILWIDRSGGQGAGCSVQLEIGILALASLEKVMPSEQDLLSIISMQTETA